MVGIVSRPPLPTPSVTDMSFDSAIFTFYSFSEPEELVYLRCNPS